MAKCRWQNADQKANRSTITAASDPDLFFGFHGAGGMLGIVTAYTTVTFPVPPVVSAPTFSNVQFYQLYTRCGTN